MITSAIRFPAHEPRTPLTMTASRFALLLLGLVVISATSVGDEAENCDTKTLKIGSSTITVTSDSDVTISTTISVDTGWGTVSVVPVGEPTEDFSIARLTNEPLREGPYFMASWIDPKLSNPSLDARIDPWEPVVRIKERPLVPEPFDSPNSKGARRFDVAPNPQALAFTPDGKTLLVACDPPGRDDRPICFVNLKTGLVTRRTIPGSSNLRGITVDPKGGYALATHLLPKSDLPATQIAQGWVFTNAISYVPLDEEQEIVTLPLDLRTQGFANPEGVAIARDGKRAYVTHAGADIVSVIDLPAFLAEVSRVADGTEPLSREGQPAYRSEDLSLTKKYVRARVPVGSGPRGVGVHFDDKYFAVFNRLDKTASVIDAEKLTVVRTVHFWGLEKDDHLRIDPIGHMGSRLFQSGKLSFSGQFSCASCHPDGHTDGLNWDLPADGFNNFHNTKSLLGVSGSSPYGWNGTSKTLRSRFAGTLRSLFQYESSDVELNAIETFLEGLDYPEHLPHRVDSQSAAAGRGKALFEGAAKCHECHSGRRLTDKVLHDVGTGNADSLEYDTPSLIRVSETAPYLHDGRAGTLEAIFREHNPHNRHGNASALDAAQLADLIEYLKSL